MSAAPVVSHQTPSQAQEPEVPRPTLETVIQETERRRAELGFKTELFEFTQRRAKLYAISGLFGSIKDLTLDQAISQAMVRIDLGEGMGFSAAESMQGIDIIANRPAISSALRAARMQAAGFSWSLQWHKEKGECAGLTLWLNYRGKPLLETKRKDDGTPIMSEDGEPVMEQAHVSFRKSDAEWMKTTIWEDGQKKRVTLLQKWIHGGGATLEDLYFARAITRAQRRYAPAVLSTSILSIEEAMDLDAEPVRYATAAPTEEKPNGKGNAGLKEALGIKTDVQASPKQETPTERENAEIPWIDRADMDEAFRSAKQTMINKFPDHGFAEFERIWKANAPIKDLQHGANVYRILQGVISTMQNLHGKEEPAR